MQFCANYQDILKASKADTLKSPINDNLRKYERKEAKKQAFTLVELIIVVSILGILAAIVLPEVQGHTQHAKEAATKDNLRILREAIERYAAEHNGIPPGYPNNDASLSPTMKSINQHLVLDNYLTELPTNPINNSSDLLLLDNSDTFPTEPQLPEAYGWIYQPATKTLKVNSTGTDSSDTLYFNY